MVSVIRNAAGEPKFAPDPGVDALHAQIQNLQRDNARLTELVSANT